MGRQGARRGEDSATNCGSVMAGITLDAGGLVALDHNDRRVIVQLARAVETSSRVTIPSSALAQAIRRPDRQARLSRLLHQPTSDVSRSTASTPSTSDDCLPPAAPPTLSTRTLWSAPVGLRSVSSPQIPMTCTRSTARSNSSSCSARHPRVWCPSRFRATTPTCHATSARCECQEVVSQPMAIESGVATRREVHR